MQTLLGPFNGEVEHIETVGPLRGKGPEGVKGPGGCQGACRRRSRGSCGFFPLSLSRMVACSGNVMCIEVWEARMMLCPHL